MTDVYAPDLYPRRRQRNYITVDRVAYLLANKGIDPALLAADLGITETVVIRMQRKLGLRPIGRKAPHTRAMRKQQCPSPQP